MENFLKVAKKIGLALGITGITGTIVTASAYTDAKINNAEINKAVIENFEKAPEQQAVNYENMANYNDFVAPQNDEGRNGNNKYKEFLETFGNPDFAIENGILKVSGANEVLGKAVNDFNNLQNLQT